MLPITVWFDRITKQMGVIRSKLSSGRTRPQGSGGPRVVIVGSALGCSSGWNIANVGAIAPEVAGAYGVGLAVVGLFTTALFLSHLLVQVPGGHWVDSVGARRVAFRGLTAIASGAALALLAPEPELAIGGRLISGIGTGLAFIAGSAYVRAWGGSAFAQGLFGGIALSAGGFALAVVPALEQVLSWRASYWSSLVVVSIAFLLLLLAPPRGARPKGPPRDKLVGGIVFDATLLRLGALYAGSFGASVVISNWVVALLERNAGATLVSAGVVGAAILVLGIVSRPLGGWIMIARPELARVAVQASLVAGAAGTVLLLAADSLWIATLGGVLVGIGGGLPFSAAFTGAAEARPDAPAAAVGLVNACANVLMIVATPLVGATFALPGEGQLGFGFVAGLWLAAFALLPGGQSLKGSAK